MYKCLSIVHSTTQQFSYRAPPAVEATDEKDWRVTFYLKFLHTHTCALHSNRSAYDSNIVLLLLCFQLVLCHCLQSYVYCWNIILLKYKNKHQKLASAFRGNDAISTNMYTRHSVLIVTLLNANDAIVIIFHSHSYCFLLYFNLSPISSCFLCLLSSKPPLIINTFSIHVSRLSFAPSFHSLHKANIKSIFIPFYVLISLRFFIISFST